MSSCRRLEIRYAAIQHTSMIDAPISTKSLKVLVYLAQIGLQIERAHAPPALHNRLNAGEEAALESVAVRERNARAAGPRAAPSG